jgi:hypothetical protein
MKRNSRIYFRGKAKNEIMEAVELKKDFGQLKHNL